MGTKINPDIAENGMHESGIRTEDSDIRCHVAPGTRNIFVFKTADAVAALSITDTKYRRTATQDGVVGPTSIGYAIPWDTIRGIRCVRWTSTEWWLWFNQKQSTSEKGLCAIRVVQQLLRDGRFPFWCNHVDEEMNRSTQINGTDLVVSGEWRIQVKCDYNAGPHGTGNIFIQTNERNPLKCI